MKLHTIRPLSISIKLFNITSTILGQELDGIKYPWYRARRNSSGVNDNVGGSQVVENAEKDILNLK